MMSFRDMRVASESAADRDYDRASRWVALGNPGLPSDLSDDARAAIKLDGAGFARRVAQFSPGCNDGISGGSTP